MLGCEGWLSASGRVIRVLLGFRVINECDDDMMAAAATFIHTVCQLSTRPERADASGDGCSSRTAMMQRAPGFRCSWRARP